MINDIDLNKFVLLYFWREKYSTSKIKKISSYRKKTGIKLFARCLHNVCIFSNYVLKNFKMVTLINISITMGGPRYKAFD